ncbi:hypothetical protein AHAS_Ahas20G0180200 [Arachis hypogaea]
MPQGGGSLTKHKTAKEAWEVISDLADLTQYLRTRNPQPKSIGEVSPSCDAILTKTLGEMTILLRQIHQSQQVPPMVLAQPQSPCIEEPSRPCGICACSSHYTNECPQLHEDNTLTVANPYPQRSTFHQSNQGPYQYGGNKGQGWRDNSTQR